MLCCLLWIMVGTLACHPGWHAALHAVGGQCGACHSCDDAHEPGTAAHEEASTCAVCAVLLHQVAVGLPAPETMGAGRVMPLGVAWPMDALVLGVRTAEPPGRGPPGKV
ncbi:MAG: hypothetical protein J0L84_09190 [Verrucomicrobia bacterium]|nr:hypothetical protein [Verrucomicrobiota bacterium]